MDTPFMEAFAQGLAAGGVRVWRFEFGYMAQRRHGGKKRPPPRVETLLEPWREVIRTARDESPDLPLWIGGKSMGGRIASMVADEFVDDVAGLICLGYPFHPPGKPEKLRTSHLEGLQTPTLVVQGERDAMGTRSEVEGYTLSDAISFCWLPDGDHSLKPRKSSGHTEAGHWATAVEAILGFMEGRL